MDTSDPVKNVTITLRLAPAEHAAWLAAAAADQRSLSGWIRRQCSGGLVSVVSAKPAAKPSARLVAKRVAKRRAR